MSAPVYGLISWYC